MLHATLPCSTLASTPMRLTPFPRWNACRPWRTWPHFASLDPQPILVALARGHMIGCVRTTWWEEEDGTWLFLHLGRIRPEWRGYGLGTAFVRWAEQRLRAQASGYPTNGRGTFGANASSTETAATELLLNEGYTVSSTSAQMERTAFTPLPGPQVPEGFALRTAAAEHSRALWEAGRRHWAGLDPRHQPANRGRLPGIPQPDHPRPRPVDGRLA